LACCSGIPTLRKGGRGGRGGGVSKAGGGSLYSKKKRNFREIGKVRADLGSKRPENILLSDGKRRGPSDAGQKKDPRKCRQPPPKKKKNKQQHPPPNKKKTPLKGGGEKKIKPLGHYRGSGGLGNKGRRIWERGGRRGGIIWGPRGKKRKT